MTDALMQILTVIVISMGAVGALAIIGLLFMIRSLRHIQVPHDADFFSTMHYVPLTLVVLLDLLDLSLDIFSAPIAWLVLDRMGLTSLRNVASVEGLLPFTGPIPTLTVSWFLARVLGLGDPRYYGDAARAARARPVERYLDDAHYTRYDDDYERRAYPETRRPRPRRPVQTIDMDADE